MNLIRKNLSSVKCFSHLFQNRNIHQKVKECLMDTSVRNIQKVADIVPLVIQEISKEDFFQKADYKKEWLKSVLEYNVLDGKQNRSNFFLQSCKYLKPKHSNEEIIQMYILGYCIELLQGYFIVLDDIMDQSITRRGKPCWYKSEDVGLNAINDGIFIYAVIPFLINRFFQNHSNYCNILELFNKINMQTILGQSLDSEYIKNPREKFQMKRYKNIVQFKTAYYSFVLPVSIAFHFNNITDKELHKISENILLKMGEIFQIQDDFLDCFGDPKVSGKIGTDIENAKCSWLAAKSYELMTPEQIKIFQECYGRPEPKNVATIKSLYSDLNLEKEYHNLIYEMKSSIESDIDKIVQFGLPKEMYYFILNKFIFRKF